MNFSARYFSIVACVAFIFGNFIACGAQMYKVSLEGDHDPLHNTSASTDPTSPTFGLHSPGGWTNLPIKFKVGNQMDPTQKAGLEAAMRTWELATGRTLFEFTGIHEGTDGDSFPDLYSSLQDAVNGHYLDHDWRKTGKPDVVLATTIWSNSARDTRTIDKADIRFNVQDYSLGDAFVLKGVYIEESGKYLDPVDMQTLAIHELGHLLGLSHVSAEVDSISIMNPYIYIGEGLTNRHLSPGDVERVQKIYGCEESACDIDAAVDAILKFNQELSANTAAN